MELQGQYAELRQRGIGLVAISYDPPDTLKAFSNARGITFPLLSDAGSVIITRYGLLNTTMKPGTRTYGVPFPGTFVLDRKGVVRTRFFEEAYQERNTTASILVRQGATPLGPAMSAETAHLTLTAGLSDAEAAPGKRLSIAIDVEPRRGMHVYAPGKHTYQVIAFTFDPQPWLKAQPLQYARPEVYHFKPLDERVNVYIKPFRLVQDVTILATPDAQKRLAGMTMLTISGSLEYQACDDKLCYQPQAIPLKWSVRVKQLTR